MIGSGFTPDWTRNWRETLKPITKHSNAKPEQTRISFDTQVKIALLVQYVVYGWCDLLLKLLWFCLYNTD